MADSGPFKIVGWMSDDFSSWLKADSPPMLPVRLLCPQQPTFGTRLGRSHGDLSLHWNEPNDAVRFQWTDTVGRASWLLVQ